MTVSVLLKKLSDLEKTAADLYGWYAEIFDTSSEAVDFFTQMKKQELRHRDIVDFQRRLLALNKTDSKDVSVEIEQVAGVIAQIEKHISEGIFELRDAIDFALLIEQSMAETHYRTLATEADSDIAKLMKSLTDGDTGHVTALQEFDKRMC